ncbi:hypothetical protein PHYC_01669 [Phycisphaerales bacterium]|nr:hypothetical protein PHYC_01669 [Phycisphaerales bacterium]
MLRARSNSGPKTRLAAGALLAALLAGCSSSVPIRTQGPRVSGQGRAAELVFPAIEVQQAGLEPGGELARRDAMLAVRDPITAFEQDAWPSPRLPSLDRARRLWLRTTPEQVLYFPRERRLPDPEWAPSPWP